jgi:hypothetical protein
MGAAAASRNQVGHCLLAKDSNLIILDKLMLITAAAAAGGALRSLCSASTAT